MITEYTYPDRKAREPGSLRKGIFRMKTRIIVCGCKDFSNREFCFNRLDSILSEYKEVEIVSGHAKGADSFGEEYAKKHGLPLKIFTPDWKRYGRAAGPIRNREMLNYSLEAKPVVIAFWNRTSKGTKDMINQATKAGVKVHIVDI